MEMKEVLRTFKIVLFIMESSTTFKISYLTIFQQALKKSTLKPSGLGALPFYISLRTSRSLSLVTSILRLKLSSLDPSLGICLVKFVMKCSMSEIVSFVIPQKC